MIKELYIKNFGKFQDFKLNFKTGINNIVGDNESGKTTIMDFVLMVFYGAGSGRKKNILENIRKKYEPWNGQQMQGYIVISKDNIDYRVERIFKSTDTTDIVKVYNNTTGEEIYLEDPKSPGVHFFSLSRDAFQKTLHISSEEVAISNSGKRDEITEKLINLVTSGDEDVSYKNAIDSLNKKIQSYTSLRGDKGILEETKSRLEDLYLLLEEAKKDERDKLALVDQIDEIKQDKENIEKQLDQLKSHKEKKRERDSIVNQIDKLEYQIALEEERLENNKYKDLEEEIVKKNSKNVITDFNLLDGSLIIALIFLILSKFSNFIYIGISLIFLILYIYNQNLKNKNKKADFEKLNDRYEADKDRAKAIFARIDLLKNELNYMNQAVSELDYEISRKNVLTYNEIDQEISSLALKSKTMEENIISIESTAKERYRGKENVSSLEKDIEDQKDLVKKLEKEKNLLIMTKDMLVKSFKEIENDFSKDLNQLASKKIEEITDGKYEKLLVDENYNIRLLDKETNELKSWQYLSSGTIDQFYLAIRLALISLIIEEKENRILFLDDIFMRFDSNRENHTRNILIKSMGELNQVLMFSNKVIIENVNIINI